MTLRMATLMCVVLFASPAVGQVPNGIHNQTGKAWQVRYAVDDLPIEHFKSAKRDDVALRIEIRLIGDDPDPTNKDAYSVNIIRYDRRTPGGAYLRREFGGEFTDVPLARLEGVAVGRRRIGLKTQPQQYTDANGDQRRMQLIAIWHPGENTGAGARADDRLHVVVRDRPVMMLEVGGDCPEEPDTDVLEETQAPPP